MTKTSPVLLGSFWFPSLVGRAKDKIDEKNLSSWKLLDDFRRRLANAQTAVPARERRPGGPERLLIEEDYFNLMLFFVATMRVATWISSGVPSFP